MIVRHVLTELVVCFLKLFRLAQLGVRVFLRLVELTEHGHMR